jgi:hypothetical protein
MLPFASLLLLSNCAVLHSRIDKKVVFNKTGDKYIQNKIDVNTCIYLSDEVIAKMPLYDSDNELWTWFFLEGLKPVFEQVIIIKNLQELNNRPDVKLIIKPELWSWISYSDNCVLGFKICFLDRSGSERFSFKLEKGNILVKDRISSLAQSMDGLMKELQSAIIQKKNELINFN